MKSDNHSSTGHEHGKLLPDAFVYPVASILLLFAIFWNLADRKYEEAASDNNGTRHVAQQQGHQHAEPKQPAAVPEARQIEQPQIQVEGETRPAIRTPQNAGTALDTGQQDSGEYGLKWLWLLTGEEFPLAFGSSGDICAADLDADGNDELYVSNGERGLITQFDILNRGSIHVRQDSRYFTKSTTLAFGWRRPGIGPPCLVIDNIFGAALFTMNGTYAALEPRCHVARRIPPADFDGDGLKDLLCIGQDGEWYEVRSADGGVLHRGPAVSGIFGNSIVSFGNFAGDGRAEILEWDTESTSILMLDSDGSRLASPFTDPSGTAALDINDDGLAELFDERGWFDPAAGRRTQVWDDYNMYGGSYYAVKFAASAEKLGVAVPRAGAEDRLLRVFTAEGRELTSGYPSANVLATTLAEVNGRNLLLLLTADGVLLMKLIAGP